MKRQQHRRSPSLRDSLVKWACLAVGCVTTGAMAADRIDESTAVALAAASSKGAAVALSPEVSAVRSQTAPPEAAPLASDGRRMTELAAVDYRLWMFRGRAGVGVGVGTVGYVPTPTGPRSDAPLSLYGAVPTLGVGVRYRVSPESALYADASGTRGMGVLPQSNYVNTKVGMEWKPAKQTFGFDHGAVGMQFDSGYKLSLKARKGGLRVYLRGQF